MPVWTGRRRALDWTLSEHAREMWVVKSEVMIVGILTIESQFGQFGGYTVEWAA